MFQIITETFKGKTTYYDYDTSAQTKRRITKRSAMLEIASMKLVCDLGHTKIYVY